MFLDLERNSIYILEDIVVPEPDHLVTHGFEVFRTLIVCGLGNGFIVVAAIYFDNKAFFQVYKIHKVRPNRMLPAELEAG